MDLYKALQDLYAERSRLDKVIAALEVLEARAQQQASEPPKRRGRKSMAGAERKAVAQRMKNYWQRRRAETGAAEPHPAPPAGKPEEPPSNES